MAVLIPDTPATCPNGERWVFDRFERDLDDDWVVLHSLGLVAHPKKLWGEIDFVVISTKGIFVIEVKGGMISCKDGRWKHERPGREPYYRNESPWKQAQGAMVALLRRLEKDAPELADFLIGYGIIMPHETFTARGPEIEPEVLLDKRTFGRNLGFFIGNLQRHWEEVYRRTRGRVPRLPSKTDIAKVRQSLRPDIESAFSLGSWFTGLNAELILLTNAQIKAARGAANNPRSIIQGRAGTGKTVVAVDRAKQLAKSNKNVLYLCFNQLLARHIQLSIADDPYASNIRVRHIHSLYREVIEKAGLRSRLAAAAGDERELFGRLYPQIFCDAALSTELQAADVLIVDEAQDVMTPENLDALDLLLSGGLRKGRWHLFLDPLQNIYGKETEKAQQSLADAGFFYYELEENCRNTRQVAIQASIISGMDIALESAAAGPACDCVFYKDRADFIRKLEGELKSLKARGVSFDDVIILSTRRLENSLLSGTPSIAGEKLTDIARADQPVSGIHFCTMHAFKGLERNVVLAIDLDGIGNDSFGMLYYAGLSRARGFLRPFIAESDRRLYDVQAKRYGERIALGRVG